jgi:hypothetical protein
MSEDRVRSRARPESAHLFSYAHLFAIKSRSLYPLLALGDGPRVRGVQKALTLDKGDGDS